MMDHYNVNFIYQLVSKIPKGKVTTYGVLAKKAGINNPRLVGKILHQNPDPEKIPCHRVVNWQGEVSKNYAFGGALVQIKKLKREGVEVVRGRVDLKKYLWVLFDFFNII